MYSAMSIATAIIFVILFVLKWNNSTARSRQEASIPILSTSTDVRMYAEARHVPLQLQQFQHDQSLSTSFDLDGLNADHTMFRRRYAEVSCYKISAALLIACWQYPGSDCKRAKDSSLAEGGGNSPEEGWKPVSKWASRYKKCRLKVGS